MSSVPVHFAAVPDGFHPDFFKEVIMRTTNEKTGEINYTQGTVDYVLMENGKPILVIDDQKFSVSDVDSVISDASREVLVSFEVSSNSIPSPSSFCFHSVNFSSSSEP